MLLSALGVLVYGASAGVEFCHEHGYVVYPRRRSLMLWGGPALLICVLVSYLPAQLVQNPRHQETMSAGIFLVCIVAWWVLQFQAVDALNPHADPSHRLRIVLARVGSTGVMTCLLWMIFAPSGDRRRKASTGVAQAVVQAAIVAALAAGGWVYANFVCYPDRAKYPRAARVTS